MAVFQGDFGKGIRTGNGVFSDPGINPCVMDGPVPVAGVNDNAIFFPKFRPGQIANGDFGSEFIYGKLVLASATDLIPGQAYWADERYTMTLGSTTNGNNPLYAETFVLNVLQPQAAAGTYYGWFQRAGHCAVKADSGSVANAQGELSSATAGNMKFPTSHTSGVKSVAPTSSLTASSGITFTGNTTSGSPYITAVSSTTGVLSPIEDLQVGMTITGTGLPSNALIFAIDTLGVGGGYRITIGTSTAGSLNTLQNATATGTGTTFTVTSHIVANLYWATLSAQN